MINIKTIFVCLFYSLALGASVRAKEKPPLVIYHDADWNNSIPSSEAIWRGVDLALSEIDYAVDGREIKILKKNHSGNVTRSLMNMKDFLSDKNGLAVFAGMHSPPLIINREFINENEIPVLVPWAAGGSITRSPAPNNYIFRLSVDDTKVGKVLAEAAVSQHQCSRPYLLMENTPWGDANTKAIKSAFEGNGIMPLGAKRFDWSMKAYVARSLIMDIVKERADCLILVSNADEGALLALSVADLAEADRIPIISHWGITGSQFHKTVSSEIREKIQLSFIQTCFSFENKPLPEVALKVLGELRRKYPDEIKDSGDLKSPAGYIHGYDLTKIFIDALRNVDLDADIVEIRKQLKNSLEALDGPTEGLIKTYRNPFRHFTLDNENAHEALSEADICMAEYGSRNQILVKPHLSDR